MRIHLGSSFFVGRMRLRDPVRETFYVRFSSRPDDLSRDEKSSMSANDSKRMQGRRRFLSLAEFYLDKFRYAPCFSEVTIA